MAEAHFHGELSSVLQLKIIPEKGVERCSAV